MLVLSRKVGERIQVGPDVVITVVRISATAVRIGIEAPQSMAISRSIVCEVDEEGELTSEPEALGSTTD